ncbi:ABC transporter permease [Brackiella oedipodis]|uniref:ABC transporter permease n=1 Tax=Brackiella oedipodis TaxID=124225 RepID=UPI000490C1E1|nr:ABC transporter permease [Brackiella oedipodis]
MRTRLRNIWYLCGKELRSVLEDYTLMALIVVIFSVVTYAVAVGVSTEVKNASIAVLNEDHSNLSYRIIDGFHAPYFKPIQNIERQEIDDALNTGKYTFILDIPVDFEKDMIAQRHPSIQLLTDATAVSQAGLGSAYIEQIIRDETAAYFAQTPAVEQLPIKAVTHIKYNPNTLSEWFIAPMQVVVNTSLLAMLLVGAAIIRELERGTIEHLLVMPVKAYEIALAKIISNSLIITIAAILSLYLVIHLWIGVPLQGSVFLFTLSTVIFLFAACSLGIFLATLTPSMPQFGLLCIPLYVVMRLLSGSESPLESMPHVIQVMTQFSPLTQFVLAAQGIILRYAGFDVIWVHLLYMTLMAIAFFTLALIRFRKMLSQQG